MNELRKRYSVESRKTQIVRRSTVRRTEREGEKKEGQDGRKEICDGCVQCKWRGGENGKCR